MIESKKRALLKNLKLSGYSDDRFGCNKLSFYREPCSNPRDNRTIFGSGYYRLLSARANMDKDHLDLRARCCSYLMYQLV